MKNIGIISDTHGYLDPQVFEYFRTCDEVWHAGDWGFHVSEPLGRTFKVRGVFGNIDGEAIRQLFNRDLIFLCEKVKVYITHIGGYPGKYEKPVLEIIQNEKPQLFISGHSHILKIIRDQQFGLLHINPGAAGNTGLHKVRTMVRLKIDEDKISDVEVVQLGMRGGNHKPARHE